MVFSEMLSERLTGAGGMVAAAGLAGVLVGAAIWLVGARFSRTIVTLLLVAAGAWIGLRVPRWMGWPIQGWATCVGGALVLGVAGYCFHRMWVGVGLAFVMTAWVALGVWEVYGAPAAFVAPAPPVRGMGVWGYTAYLGQLWDALPADVRRVGPFLCGVALVSGVAIAVLWQRLAGWALFSLVGVSLVVSMGLVTLLAGRPQMLDLVVPKAQSTQWAVLVGMAVVGVVAQWMLGGKAALAEGSSRVRQNRDPGED